MSKPFRTLRARNRPATLRRRRLARLRGTQQLLVGVSQHAVSGTLRLGAEVVQVVAVHRQTFTVSSADSPIAAQASSAAVRCRPK